MKALIASLAACMGITLALAGRVQAQTITEIWRTPLGKAVALSIDPTDSSCWANMGADLTHVSATGEVLGQRSGRFTGPILVDPSNKSWWAVDASQGRVAHFSAAGDLLWSTDAYLHPLSVAVNFADGSIWIGYEGGDDGSGGEVPGGVVHRAPDGTVLSFTAVHAPGSLAVSPLDGSCWVGGSNAYHISDTGEAVWLTGSYDYCVVAVDTADGSCWVASCSGSITHYSSADAPIGSAQLYSRIAGVSANPLDGSCWVVTDCGANDSSGVVHLASDGTQQWSSDQIHFARSVAVDPADGSCWIGDWEEARLVHLSSDQTEQWSGQGFAHAFSISANTANDSLWVADRLGEQVVQLSAAGGPLWSSTGEGARLADGVSVNEANGSCWMADIVTGRVTHVSDIGAELWSGQVLTPNDAFCYLASSLVSTNPTDGSCWVADIMAGRVLHLSASGEQLWARGDFYLPAVAVNPTDGSCWIGDRTSVLHVSATGEELWSGDVDYDWGHYVASLAVNPRDGSVWVGVSYQQYISGQLLHLAADGRMLPANDLIGDPVAVAVNAVDGTCWVAPRGWSPGITQLSPEGDHLHSIAACCPVGVAVDPDGSLWVSECGSGQVARFTVPHAAHNFYLTGNTPVPAAVNSGGDATLSAIAVDTPDHGVASWSWSDGGAGGTFSPSANVATPTYTAPRNFSGSDQTVTLTVTATCAGDPPLTATTTVPLTVHTEYTLRIGMGGLGFVQVNGVTQRLPYEGHFDPGETINLSALPSTGYQFASWLGDATGSSSLSLTMDHDYSLTALFSLASGTVYFFPVDYPEEEFGDWTGWASPSASGTGWEWGAPAAGGGQPTGTGGAMEGVDPATSHTGDTIVGYVIGGNYQPGLSPQYLTTPPLDFRGRQNVRLHFWRWLAVEDGSYDTAAVEVNAGNGWQQVWTNPTSDLFETGWTEVDYPLPQADGKDGVQVRWQMGGTDVWGTPTEYGGWSLDDISLECDRDYFRLGEFYLQRYQLWGQAEGEADFLAIAVGNFGETTWDDTYGLRLRSPNIPTGAWGFDSLPVTDPVAPSEDWVSTVDTVTPPVSTIGYPAPVGALDAGTDSPLLTQWGIWHDFVGFIDGDFPIQQPVSISRFEDVQPFSDAAWTRFYVEELAGAVPLVVAGYDDGLYHPEYPVTRDQMAVYIARALGLDTSHVDGTVFRDVTADTWGAGAIEALAAVHIVDGYGDGTYQPLVAVTRDAMCKFIANGRQTIDPGFWIPDTVTEALFTDVPADHWAARWISACRNSSLVQGYEDGSYQPASGVDRGQMAVFVWRGFLRDRDSLVVLGGPTLSAYAPTADRYAVGSVSTATIGDTLYASVLLDAVRNRNGTPVTAEFELRRIISDTESEPAGTYTASLDADQLYTAYTAAAASGVPYLPLSAAIDTTTLGAGTYQLITRLNGVTLPRRPEVVVQAP